MGSTTAVRGSVELAQSLPQRPEKTTPDLPREFSHTFTEALMSTEACNHPRYFLQRRQPPTGQIAVAVPADPMRGRPRRPEEPLRSRPRRAAPADAPPSNPRRTRPPHPRPPPLPRPQPAPQLVESARSEGMELILPLTAGPSSEPSAACQTRCTTHRTVAPGAAAYRSPIIRGTRRATDAPISAGMAKA